MHSSVYRVFWPSCRVVDCNILILFRHSTTGPEHPVYIRAFETYEGGPEKFGFMDKELLNHLYTGNILTKCNRMGCRSDLYIQSLQYHFRNILNIIK